MTGGLRRVHDMRLLARMGTLRTVVAMLTLIIALQMTLVAFGNITDFGTNQAFVVHVFAMDTTFRSPHMMWRAITDPGVATAAYIVIIAWESLTALVLIAGCVAWTRALFGRGELQVARQLSACGWLMELMLFGGGFIAIGGEWFQMWQSSKWNGSTAAFQNVVIASIALVLAHLPERTESESAIRPS